LPETGEAYPGQAIFDTIRQVSDVMGKEISPISGNPAEI
jgi:hypothetical protein